MELHSIPFGGMYSLYGGVSWRLLLTLQVFRLSLAVIECIYCRGVVHLVLFCFCLTIDWEE